MTTTTATDETKNPNLVLQVKETKNKQGKYIYTVLVDGQVMNSRQSNRVYFAAPIFRATSLKNGDTWFVVYNSFIGRPDLCQRWLGTREFKSALRATDEAYAENIALMCERDAVRFEGEGKTSDADKSRKLAAQYRERGAIAWTFEGFATVQNNPTPDPGKTQDTGSRSLDEIDGPEDHKRTPETEAKIKEVTQAIAAGKKFKSNGEPIEEIFIGTLHEFTDDMVLVKFRNEGGLSRSIDINDIEVLEIPADKTAISEDLKREYFKFDVKISKTIYGNTASWENYKNPEDLEGAPGNLDRVTWYVYESTDKKALICRYFVGSGTPPTISSADLYDTVPASGNFEDDVYNIWLTEPEFRNPAPKSEE